MNLVIHHSGGKQFVSKPEEVGGNFEFYNKIITPIQIFDQHENKHPRGSFETYDICFTGNFLNNFPTDFQKEALNGLIKKYNLPVIRHKDLKDYGAILGTLETECPGKLTTYEFTISSNKDLPELKEVLLKYGLDLKVKRFNLDILGKLDGDQALKLVRDLKIDGSFLLFCQGNNDQWSDAVTHYDTVQNVPYTIAENSVSTFLLTMEIAHQIQKFYNGHRGSLPSIEVLDIYTPGETFIKRKFQSVMPYLPLLGESANNMKFELVKVVGNSEVWLVRGGKKSHVYNAQALLMVADFSDIKEITQDEFNSIPDSGFELASLVKE